MKSVHVLHQLVPLHINCQLRVANHCVGSRQAFDNEAVPAAAAAATVMIS